MEEFEPQNLESALDILDKRDVDIISGGTDCMIKKRGEPGLLPRFEKNVMFISRIKELNSIEKNGTYLKIGSTITYGQMEKSPIIPESFEKVINNIAAPAIRNMGTIGGNICNASPAADMLPILYALNSTLEIVSAKGTRKVDIKDFIIGPGKTVLMKNEILKSIEVPLDDFNLFCYRKIGSRKAVAISKLSFIGFSRVSKGKILDVRISFGAVGPTVLRINEAEEEVKKFDFKEAFDMYKSALKPIDDQRSTAHYRKKVSLNLLKYFIDKIKGEL